MTEEKTLQDKCSIFLYSKWDEIKKLISSDINIKFVDDEKISKINKILTSEIKSYHYVLPTHILAKCANPKIDCRSIQASFNSLGSFDARSIAHKIIVPFDKQNHNVLGGSNEPYVNNPLRVPGIVKEFRNQQKNKEDWDLLCDLLQEIEDNNDFAYSINFFSQILCEIYKLLSGVHVIYPTPSRISFAKTKEIILNYINEKSGGEHLETITVSILRTIGELFNLFDRIERSKVNASDTSTGQVADIECWKGEQILLAVEVKDKELTLTQFESTIEKARANKITEILFIAEKDIENDQEDEIEKKVNQEFISGQNIYINDFFSFCNGILVLLGEKGRVLFLINVGVELDRINANIENKKVWAEILKNV